MPKTHFARSLAVFAAAVLIVGCAGPSYRAGTTGRPYSAAVTYRGLTFVAGKIGSERGPGVSFEAEVNSAIDALAAELQKDGLTLNDCLTATVYLTDMARYEEFNAIYGPRFTTPPARACVAVKELPLGARVEIQVVARAR